MIAVIYTENQAGRNGLVFLKIIRITFTSGIIPHPFDYNNSHLEETLSSNYNIWEELFS